jgi:hypothetical protein
VLQALRGLGPVKGAAGDVTVTRQGLLRSVFVLQVSGGHVDEIAESSSGRAQDAAGAERRPAPLVVATRPTPEQPRQLEGPTLRDEPLDGPSSAPARTESHTTPLPPVTAPATTGGALTNAKVACLLPLSGPDQAYGKRALAGLRLAFDDAPEQLLVRDTGGDPSTAADWLLRLQHDTEVVAVVGPLRSTEAEVVAPMAEQQHLPLLLLSQREGLGGRYVMQVGMTRAQQIRLLVHYAATELKLRRFGIVYPNDGYGSAFAETFRKEAASNGGSVVGTHPYPPGTTSFASSVVDVRGWQRAGLDALFIPDAPPTATVLAADIRSEVPGVVLLGMALRQVMARGEASRERIVAELAALGTFQGAGELRAAPRGFERRVSLLRFHDGKVEEVSAGTTAG